MGLRYNEIEDIWQEAYNEERIDNAGHHNRHLIAFRKTFFEKIEERIDADT